MITQLRRHFTRPTINHDDNGSMILALFVIVVLTALVTVVLMVTISQQAKTRKATDFTFAGQAVDTAVNDALLMANNFGPASAGGAGDVAYWTAANPRPAQVTGEFMWTWYSTAPALTATSSNPATSYVIHATGCRNKGTTPPTCTSSSSRTMNATLSGTVVNGVDNRPSKTAYILDPYRNFNRALFADNDLIMQGASTVESYNSATGNQNTGFGRVATNGLVTFDSSAVPGNIFLSNTQAQPSVNRCSANDSVSGDAQPCDLLAVRNMRPRFQISSTTFIGDTLARPRASTQPGCGGEQLEPWVASEAPTPGHLTFPAIGPLCFSSMNFDVNTTVDPPTNDVYVTGPIIVAPGVTINVPNPTPAAATLKIFSSGSVVSIGGGTSAAAQTQVAWALWAPKAMCATNPATGFVTMYGSMVCNKIFTQGAFTAKWDEALGDPPNPALSTVIWDVTGYRECWSTCSAS